MRVFGSELNSVWACAILGCTCATFVPGAAGAAAARASVCGTDDSGLKLPAGFCATVFADGIGHARQLAVAPNGVVYVNTWSGRYYGDDVPHAGGFLVALQDTTGTGRANVIERFGETVQSGGAGGTGIGIYQGALYAELNDKILRYPFDAGSIVPGAPETVVSGLPLTGDHPMHPFAIDADGSMYVDVATATNACQRENRAPKSPGLEPCTELETRGGIWRYDANKINQVFSPAERFATGIRNAEGYGVDMADHRIYFTQHGRDQLHMNWPHLYRPDQEATLPSEELLLLKQGGDYGWPRCYFDPFRHKLILAPEYGGNGKKSGLCAQKIAPVAAFPAHWAPNGMVFYDKAQFPARYRDGVFIAFHGSWDRSPYAQSGYNVVFQGLTGESAGRCEIFADGFAGGVKSPDQAWHRPDGVAVGADGALYVSDDVRGRIYRIAYQGGGSAKITPCPSLVAAPRKLRPIQSAAEGAAVAAPKAADLPVPNGATREMLLEGDRIYHGEAGGAGCAGCHGANGGGGPLGPNLTDAEWLWSDGSLRGIAMTIHNGVMQPKRYRAPMPPMGGAQLSADQVSAVAVYVWGLSHR